MATSESEICEGRRVAVYSQDGLGIGHLRRTNSVAAALLEKNDTCSVLTICDSPSDQYFQPTGRHDRLKLPTVVKRGPGLWDVPTLGTSFADIHRLRSSVLSAALGAFAPDLLLVDHMPHGVMGELLPALALLRSQSPNTKIVLGLRDIIDDPQVVRQRWTAEGAYQAIEQYYDEVLVYGSADLYPLADLYEFPSSICERTTYCGYVIPLHPPTAADIGAARARLVGCDDLNLVVVMGGSGADAAPMMSAAIRSYPTINRRSRTVMVVICGPNMPDSQRSDLKQLANSADIHFIDSVGDAAAVMAAADAVVAMAGYNSSAELVASGTPTVLIPRPGPSLEQRTRARIFSTRGWVEMVDPDDLDDETLATAIERALDTSIDRTRNGVLDLGGLDRVQTILSSLLYETQWASPLLT